MDPEATLREARSHMNALGEREETAQSLVDYFRWRLKGGFPPENGDFRAFSMLESLGGIADTFSEALVVD